ncbi:MAG: pseudouridine synthase [Saprospiraceae bacterium]|nr:pseudouridine synthase [Saprospiraceae bacterium]
MEKSKSKYKSVESSKSYSYYVFHKPFGVLCQFTPETPGQKCLRDYLTIESDVYPIGRLDKDSEGLLLLSNDKRLNHQILSPEKFIVKTYCCQVEGQIKPEAISLLLKGLQVRIKKQWLFLKAVKIDILEKDPEFQARVPPIRMRIHQPVSWIKIGIAEGKNHQVRKMLAAAGFPVLRLIRSAIGNLSLGALPPGDYRQISLKEIEKKVMAE